MICDICQKYEECAPYIQNLQKSLHKPIHFLCSIGVSEFPLDQKMDIAQKKISERRSVEKQKQPELRRAVFISKPLDHGNYKELANPILVSVFQ